MENILTESLEDYLEAIYNIILKKNGVRVKDIAKYLKVKNSSVTTALKTLSKEEYINYEPYGVISLTEKGNEKSQEITEKHRILKYFFKNILFIDKNISENIACKLEHFFSEDVFKKFIQFINFLILYNEQNPDLFKRLLEFYNKNETNVSSKEYDIDS